MDNPHRVVYPLALKPEHTRPVLHRPSVNTDILWNLTRSGTSCAGLLCYRGVADTLEETPMATHDASNTHGRPLFGLRKTFISEVAPPQEYAGPAWWFAFHRNRLLVEVVDDAVRVPCRERVEELGVTVVQRHYLGRYDGLPCGGSGG
jgi:hypothetical protein